MRNKYLLAGVISVCISATSAEAQQPPPPAVPVINPAQARLDFTLEGLGGPGFAIARSEEMDALVAGCEDGTIRFWEKAALTSGMVATRPSVTMKAHEGPILALAWSGGPVLASAGTDRKIVLWTMADKKPAQTVTIGSVVRAMAMSPDSKRLASSNDDNSIQLTDVATAKPAAKLSEHTDWVLALAFNADGKRLASGGFDGVVKIWDAEGMKKILDIPIKPATPPPPTTPPPPPIGVGSLAFSADGKLLAVGGADGQIYLYNPADGKLVRAMPGHTSAVTSLAFHPNNTLLVSCSKDRTVRLWNLATGQPFKVLEGHTAWAQGLTLMSKGSRVASVGADQTVRVWDLSEPMKKK